MYNEIKRAYKLEKLHNKFHHFASEIVNNLENTFDIYLR